MQGYERNKKGPTCHGRASRGWRHHYATDSLLQSQTNAIPSGRCPLDTGREIWQIVLRIYFIVYGVFFMNLANDERIRKLNDQIQAETEPAKMTALVEQLTRLLDELNPPKTVQAERPPTGANALSRD